MKRLTATCSFTLLLTILATAPPASSQIKEVRTIPLVAMTSDGQVVADLTTQNLRIKGIKATVKNITFDASPRRVILLLDISASMGEPRDYYGKEKSDYAREMAKAFLMEAPPQDLLALDVFAEKEREVVSSTHDFASIRTAIDALPKQSSKPAKSRYGARTYVGDALHTILSSTDGRLGFGDSIILFSDGEYDEMGGVTGDTGKRPLDSVKKELAQRGVRVFLVLALTKGMHPSDFPNSLFRQILGNVSAFMVQTGGFSFAPESFSVDSIGYPEIWQEPEIYRSSPLPKRMAALDAAIQGTHRLQLQSEQPIRKRRNLRLELINNKGNVVKTVLLLYPRNLYPDSPKTH